MGGPPLGAPLVKLLRVLFLAADPVGGEYAGVEEFVPASRARFTFPLA